MTTGPHISLCHWSKSYLHDKDVSVEQISECLEFPYSRFISLNAILFRCALLHTTQRSSDLGLHWRGHDRLITPNTEFLMSHYGLPFSASCSVSANWLVEWGLCKVTVRTGKISCADPPSTTCLGKWRENTAGNKISHTTGRSWTLLLLCGMSVLL